MSAQHTPGRVKVQHPHAGDRGWEVAFDPGLEQLCQNITEGNARRLVACWNACEGIPTEDLEHYYGDRGGLDAALDQASLRDHTTAVQQRDELLAALRRLSFAALCRDSTMGDPCRLMEVRAELHAANMHATAAIAKATTPAGTGPANNDAHP